MYKWMTKILHFLLTILGIFMISNLPYLFIENFKPVQMILTMIYSGELNNGSFLYSDVGFKPWNYFHHMYMTFLDLFHLTGQTYFVLGHQERVFPTFFNDYLYSMIIFCGALLLGVIFSGILSLIIILLPLRLKNFIKIFFKLMQSVPDIFHILVIQGLVILFIQTTGWKVFKVYGGYNDPIYALPMLCLALLPTIFITFFLLGLLEDQENELYVELAKTKGIRKSMIYIKHIYRNVLGSLFIHFKSIFWFTLSSLLMIEVIFGINGFLFFIYRYAPETPKLMTFALLMIFIPFFILFTLIQAFLEKKGMLSHENSLL